MSRRKIAIIVVIAIVLLIAIVVVVAWYMFTQQTVAIYVDTLPVKTEYWVNEEFESNGLVVKQLKRIQNFNCEIPYEQLEITGFDSSVACEEQTVTVTYGKFSTSFTVTINERPAPQKVVIGVKIQGKDGAELKTDYQLFEMLDVENIELVVTYNDMSTEIIPATHPDVKIEGYDWREPATNLEVRIIYQGFFDRMYVNIIM